MLLRLSALCIAFGMVCTAQAATLSVNSDKLTYLVGETITLSISGDDGGASTFGVFGRLDYSGALVDNGTRSQIQLVGQNGNWNTGVLFQGDNGISAYSWSFNQIPATLNPDTANNLPGPLSTVTLIAMNLGVVNVTWHTAIDGDQLNFFGLTNAPGTSFTIVPEPATLALIGLGLLGFAGWRRARD